MFEFAAGPTTEIVEARVVAVESACLLRREWSRDGARGSVAVGVMDCATARAAIREVPAYRDYEAAPVLRVRVALPVEAASSGSKGVVHVPRDAPCAPGDRIAVRVVYWDAGGPEMTVPDGEGCLP